MHDGAMRLRRVWLASTVVPKLRTLAAEAARFYCGDINKEEFKEDENVQYFKHMLEIMDVNASLF